MQPNSWLPSDDSESVGQKLKVHLNDQRNFKDFNKTPMSKTLIQKFAEFSSAYIIPRPGKKSRGYGFFVSGAPYPRVSLDVEHDGDQKDLKYIISSFKKTGLWSDHAQALYEELPPNVRWDIYKFTDKVVETLERIEDAEPVCNVLIFILACHGFNQEICGADGSSQNVIEFLLNMSREKMQGIPKVRLQSFAYVTDYPFCQSHGQISKI